MGQNTNIEWCDHTFNPWRGCTKVSAGCANCYAETLSARNHATLGIWGDNGNRVVAGKNMWIEPHKWDADAMKAGVRRRVFCASLCDVLEDWQGEIGDAKGEVMMHCNHCDRLFAGRAVCGNCGPDDVRPAKMMHVREKLWHTIINTPNLDWLLLTKRPENARDMLPDRWLDIRWPDNVWMGVSVEDQAAADKRIPELLRIPARVRFLSCEPLIGPVDLRKWMPTKANWQCQKCGGFAENFGECTHCGAGSAYLSGSHAGNKRPAMRWGNGQPIDWVIVGGESGTNARPVHPHWVEVIRDQCVNAKTPFFFKQWGEWLPGSQVGRLFTDAQLSNFLVTSIETQVCTWKSTNYCFKVGKKKSGRKFDGFEWMQFPKPGTEAAR